MKHLKEISAEKVERVGEMEDLVPEEFVFYIERKYIVLPMRRAKKMFRQKKKLAKKFKQKKALANSVLAKRKLANSVLAKKSLANCDLAKNVTGK